VRHYAAAMRDPRDLKIGRIVTKISSFPGCAAS
jgi:hypothetical protein